MFLTFFYSIVFVPFGPCLCVASHTRNIQPKSIEQRWSQLCGTGGVIKKHASSSKESSDPIGTEDVKSNNI